MKLTLEDRMWIEAGLEELYRGISANIEIDPSQIRKYIDVGEFGLALDELADLYMDIETPVPSATLTVFHALATKMKMTSGDEWQAVLEILSIKQRVQQPN